MAIYVCVATTAVAYQGSIYRGGQQIDVAPGVEMNKHWRQVGLPPEPVADAAPAEAPQPKKRGPGRPPKVRPPEEV